MLCSIDIAFNEESFRWQVQQGQSLCTFPSFSDLKTGAAVGTVSFEKFTLRSAENCTETLGEDGGFFLRIDIIEALCSP
jgi:hypothetical protein